MTAGQWFQVAGGVAELLGLATVAMGIAATRERFTNKPSILGRLGRKFDQALYWLWKQFDRGSKPPAQTLRFSGIGSGEMFGEPTVIRGFGCSLHDQIKEMQQRIQQLEEGIENTSRALRDEKAEREKADQELSKGIEESKKDVQGFISDAVAGGLRLETLGVLLFAAGVASTITGVLVG